MKQRITRGQHNATSPNTNRSSMHQERSKGFSLAEVMVLLTILCMVFILGLQWYLNSPMNQSTGFWRGVRDIFSVSSPLAASQANSEGDFDDSPLTSANQQTSEDSVIIDDDAIAAGAPTFLAEQNSLVLQFGQASSGVSIHVPGRVIVSRMPVATTDEMTDIHWFYPE